MFLRIIQNLRKMYRVVFENVELQILKYHKLRFFIILEKVRSKLLQLFLIALNVVKTVIVTKFYQFPLSRFRDKRH
jgi:hypothetical protein